MCNVGKLFVAIWKKRNEKKRRKKKTSQLGQETETETETETKLSFPRIEERSC